jgi:hypothetical protein
MFFVRCVFVLVFLGLQHFVGDYVCGWGERIWEYKEGGEVGLSKEGCCVVIKLVGGGEVLVFMVFVDAYPTLEIGC